MKLSLNWIRDYIDMPADMDLGRMAYDLTMSTVEVEGAEQLADRFANIIVGEIKAIVCTTLTILGKLKAVISREYKFIIIGTQPPKATTGAI